MQDFFMLFKIKTHCLPRTGKLLSQRLTIYVASKFKERRACSVCCKSAVAKTIFNEFWQCLMLLFERL